MSSLELELGTRGVVLARDYTHERRLAGSVLSGKCVDFTGLQVELDVVKRDHTLELDAHVAKVKQTHLAPRAASE
jgi:hypothetical protein